MRKDLRASRRARAEAEHVGSVRIEVNSDLNYNAHSTENLIGTALISYTKNLTLSTLSARLKS